MPQSISPEFQAILNTVVNLLYNDDEQNKTLPEPFRSQITGGLNCDQLPGTHGEFGFTLSNPIPTNGPLGQVFYLSRLRTTTGSPVMFHRVRTEAGPSGTVDVYDVLSLDGTVREALFLSMYHPRKSRRVPRGFNFAARFDPSNLTYGVNHIVANFPQKLDAHIRKWQMDTLGVPLPVGNVREAINGSRFHPSVLEHSDGADLSALQRQVRDDLLSLAKAAQDPRFTGTPIAIGIDGLIHPMGDAPAPEHSQDLRQTLIALDSALTQYISVHNDLFRLKLRRIIPAPFIFSRINFPRNSMLLSETSNKLKSLHQRVSHQHPPGVDILTRFTVALHATVEKLRAISDKLERKSEGAAYPWRDYRRDMDEYQALETAHVALGKQLNTWAAS